MIDRIKKSSRSLSKKPKPHFANKKTLKSSFHPIVKQNQSREFNRNSSWSQGRVNLYKKLNRILAKNHVISPRRKKCPKDIIKKHWDNEDHSSFMKSIHFNGGA